MSDTNEPKVHITKEQVIDCISLLKFAKFDTEELSDQRDNLVKKIYETTH